VFSRILAASLPFCNLHSYKKTYNLTIFLCMLLHRYGKLENRIYAQVDCKKIIIHILCMCFIEVPLDKGLTWNIFPFCDGCLLFLRAHFHTFTSHRYSLNSISTSFILVAFTSFHHYHYVYYGVIQVFWIYIIDENVENLGPD